jgi:hypothetical protein
MIYLCRELRDGTGIKHALAGSASPLAKIDPVSAKKSVAKLLAYDSWLGAKIRKIPLVAPGTWIGGKVRQVISRGNIVEFASQSVSFRSSRVIHALLTPEMVADLSLYIQTSRGL